MLNKNVADYTNFDGKTNKKIVQAPGGASSFSLAWSQDKTDYGPQRIIKKKQVSQGHYEQPPLQQYQKPSNYNYNEPIRVMEQPHQNYQPPIGAYRQDSYPIHNSHTPSSSASKSNKYGGQYGYNNYVPEPVSSNQYQPPNRQSYRQQQDALDLKMQEHLSNKNYTPSTNKSPHPQLPSQSSGGSKPSIKIYQQRNNLIIGDNNYNYWKEPADNGRKVSHQSNRRPPTYEQPPIQVSQPERTSVKVHNPPGGRTNFTLG